MPNIISVYLRKIYYVLVIAALSIESGCSTVHDAVLFKALFPNYVINYVFFLVDGAIKTANVQSVLAEKILIKNDYILSVLKPDNCNRQLIYIPTYLHENDFTSCKSYYELSKVKLCICG